MMTPIKRLESVELLEPVEPHETVGKLERSKPSCKLLTFLGTTPNIGTTLLAFASSVRIAERTGKRVAYLCLNLKSSKLHRYIGIDDPHASLDELLPTLRNESLSKEQLHHAMHRYHNQLELYVLFGNRYRETAEYYGVEELTHLIDTARKLYDYVLLDVNAYWDNAGTISALLETEALVLTTTEALSHFQEDYIAWTGMMGQHIQLSSKQLYHSVIKHRGLYHNRDCKHQLPGQALPEVIIPPTLYEALDRGELKQWMQTGEGSKWLTSYCKALIPETRYMTDKTKKNGYRLGWLHTFTAGLTKTK